LIARHGRPKEGVESIFIEVNKRLFIDTTTFKKTANFDDLKRSIDQLVAEVVAYARQRAAS
jgi:N-formylglutamate amidohydrolase